MLILATAAIAALTLLAIVLTFFAFRETDGAEAGATPGGLADAGCTVKTFPAQPRDHVEQLKKGFKYNSDPPSSGPHHPVPAIFGIYDAPIEQIRLVHNLEHGAVVVQYGNGVARGEIEALTEWYRDNPNGLVVAPYSALGNKIALTAWNGPQEGAGKGILATCPRFDEGAFETFVEEYGFKAPESDRGDGLGFAREDLTPGT